MGGLLVVVVVVVLLVVLVVVLVIVVVGHGDGYRYIEQGRMDTAGAGGPAKVDAVVASASGHSAGTKTLRPGTHTNRTTAGT